MSRKRKAEQTDPSTQDGANVPALDQSHEAESETQDTESEQETPSVPPRANNEVLQFVLDAGATITGCSESEVKNYLATMDFLFRGLAVKFATSWPKICKTARHAGEENEKAAKVPVGIKVIIDHTNILLMDTKYDLGFSEKHKDGDSTQEDLSQIEFPLSQ